MRVKLYSNSQKNKTKIMEALRRKGINLPSEEFMENYVNQVLVMFRGVYEVCSHLLFDFSTP